MADPWDLGRPGASESLWLETDGSSRKAHRAERLAARPGADTPKPRSLDMLGRTSPYKGAQLVTVLHDASGSNLYVDGALAKLGAVTLPPPQLADLKGSEGYYAPLVFSTLVVGTGVPPAEVTVEYVQGAALLESARMQPAVDTDYESDCYLFPYPVRQELHQVRAEWYDSRSERKDFSFENDDGRDLGFLKPALTRVRTIFEDMTPNKSASGTVVPARRPATKDYRKMGAIHRCLLAYAFQGIDRDLTKTTGLEDNGMFGPGKRYGLKERNTPLDGAGGPTRGFFHFYPRSVDAMIIVSIKGVAKWWLSQPERAPSINAHFQASRARLDTLFPPLDAVEGVKSIQQAFDAVEIPERPDLDPDKRINNKPIAFMRTEVVRALMNDPTATQVTPPSGYQNKPPPLMRVYGPPLLRKPTQQAPLQRGDEEEEVREARAAVRDAQRALVHDFEIAQRHNRGPLRIVACFDTKAMPDPHHELHAHSPATGSNVVMRGFSELRSRKNAFVTSGVPPLGVEACTGAFRPTDAITEAQVRARLGSDKPTDALTRLGLNHTPEAQAALVAFADLVVHECLREGSRGLDDPIDSAARRAQRHAVAAARLLRSMYAATERTSRLFLRHSDPLFVTAPGGRAALVCVRHLPCWVIAIGRDEADESDGGLNRPLWSSACRKSAAAFTEALSRLGKVERTPVHPVALPLVPLQALWTWPPTGPTATTHGTPLIERQRQLAQGSAARAGDSASTTQHTQMHAARASLARVLRLVRTLSNDVSKIALAANHVLYARPAAVRAGAKADLTEAEVDGLLEASGAGHSRAPSAVGSDALRAAWARRALDTFSRWRHEDVRNAEDDVAVALAKLALGPPASGDEVQNFYVPYGLSLGASPLAGNNSASSELRVWTRFMVWTPSSSARAGLTLAAKPCTPYDGVLTDNDSIRVHVHPYVFTLNHHASPTLAVPINVEALGDGLEAAVDRVRCIAFTAERFYQAMQCAIATGIDDLTLDLNDIPHDPSTNSTNPVLAKRCAAAFALALGLLPNTAARSFSIHMASVYTGFEDARLLINAAALAVHANALPVIALGEAAAAVAAAMG